MSRQIQLTLEGLIPRHSGPLPPELVELASSLLAQSRSKCSNLKKEEEIARGYICANIACERLKQPLDLPPIEPRPPCPPALYKKLYTYFDKALPSAHSSSKKRARTTKGTPEVRGKERGTPTKDKAFAGFQASKAGRKGVKYGVKDKREQRLPKWVGVAIRTLCREFDAPTAIPHIYAGVETVMFSAPPVDSDETRVEDKTAGLVAAVWFYVMTRLAGKETSNAQYKEREKKVLRLLEGLREDMRVQDKIGNGEETWKGWEVVTKKDVDLWMGELAAKKWIEMDWLQDIVSGQGFGEPGDYEESEEDVEESQLSGKRRKKDVRRNMAMGTMLQPEVDFLSDEKREVFDKWKTQLRSKIERLIKAGFINTKD